jgi:DNA-directed RNA polymerase sigma subunit (sigma70/sigma32)
MPRKDNTAYSRAHREETIERDLGGLDRVARTNLGLELLCMHAKRGVKLTRDDIAAWCGCTQEAIRRIEVQALRRLRKARTHIRAEFRLHVS